MKRGGGDCGVEGGSVGKEKKENRERAFWALKKEKKESQAPP